MIRKTALENFNLMQAGIESITRQRLNSEQIKYLREQIGIGWANVAIGEKSVSNEAEKIAGADTKVAEREAEMLESQSEFNRRMTKLQDSHDTNLHTRTKNSSRIFLYSSTRKESLGGSP